MVCGGGVRGGMGIKSGGTGLYEEEGVKGMSMLNFKVIARNTSELW